MSLNNNPLNTAKTPIVESKVSEVTLAIAEEQSSPKIENESTKGMSKELDTEKHDQTASGNPAKENEDAINESPKPKIPVKTIDKNNWHLALSYSGIEGNGLQVLLNSLAEYANNQLLISYLPKVQHFLTDSLNESMIEHLQDYFDESNLTIVLKPKDELVKTPKDRKIKRHEEDVEIFCQKLIENPCVAKLQNELGAVIDKQTISVKSRDF